jgi:cell division protein FtsB
VRALRWLLLVVVLGLAGLQVPALVRGRGFRRGDRAEQKVQQKRENTGLQQRNDALVAEVKDLKDGEAAIEERAQRAGHDQARREVLPRGRSDGFVGQRHAGAGVSR